MDAAIKKYIYSENNFFVIDKGRNDKERAVVKVSNGSYRGFGYIDEQDVENEVLRNGSIKPYADNKDIQVIIKGYLRKYPDVKLIKF